MAIESNAMVLTIADDKKHVKRIWTAFWILLGLTIAELICGLLIYVLQKGSPSYGLILFIKLVIITFTLAKAFYIITIFMHLGDEIRNMILSIAVPMCLFFWFITVFLWDGSAFRVNRNTDAGSRKYVPQEIRHQPLNIPPGAEGKYKLH